MTWFRFVPAWFWVALGALLIIGGQQLRIDSLQTDVAQGESRYDKHIADDAAAITAATEAARVEEKRRQAAVEGIQNDAGEQIQAARVDAARAGDALTSLQQRYAQLAATSRACGNSITSSLGTAADDAARMQADMFGRLGTNAARYAQIADERGVAGNACERYYDALK